MISLQIAETLRETELETEGLSALLIKTAALASATASGLADPDATIVLTDDDQITDLNRTYLGINSPTDVLSFPSGDKDPETGIVYLGDVIISFPRAEAQAAAGGHPVYAELQLLVVHGMLHLCGYDHAEESDKAVMWEIQQDILKKLNCSITGPSLAQET